MTEQDWPEREVRKIGNLKAFIRAVLCGSLAGGGIFLPLTMVVGVGLFFDGEILMAPLVALSPVLISGAAVLTSAIVVGLPLTALLRHWDMESAATYTGLGAFSGFLLPGFYIWFESEAGSGGFAALFGFILGLLGGFAGLVTGSVWGEWRERVAREAEETAPE